MALHELALARVLAGGLRRVHPDWRLTALILDGDPPAGEAFATVGMDALDGYRPGLLEALTDGPHSLATALRPALMAGLAEQSQTVVVWLDPTVRLLGSLESVVAAARDALALVPLHGRLEPPLGLRARGTFESGIVAAEDTAALRWWSELIVSDALGRGATFDPLAGHLLGAVAGAVERSRIARGAGLGAGWWSLAAGQRLDDGPWRIDGVELAALNLAGFDPARPHWLSDEDVDGRAAVSANPALAPLLAEHVRDLAAAGWQPDSTGEWRYSTLPGGLPLDDDIRDLFALAHREGVALGDPFSVAGAAALLDWIDGESAVGAGVSWYLERVHRRRADLQVAFPDLAGGDGLGLATWERDHGAAEEPVLAALAERRSGRPRHAVHQGRAKTGGGVASVRIVGYLRDGLGLGEAARSYARALTAAGLGVEAVAVPAPMEQFGDAGRPARRQRVAWEAPPPVDGSPPTVEIVCVNPPELMRLQRAGVGKTEGVHRIGVWAWELDALPADWGDAFELVDEVWAYSEYVASAFRGAPVPVTVMPLTIDVERLEHAGAVSSGGEPFTFLFVFDLLSSLERKNPLGLIEAFRSAFALGEGPRLLIKTSNGDNRPQELEQLRVAALGRPDVEVVDEFLPADERDALIADCDCYVSLHRAEGFGLTLAEAMAAGRPAIATGFSGNLDFMTSDTARLVRWSAELVKPGSAIYTAGASWAEPDLADAAAALREAWSAPDTLRARAERGQEHVRRRLAPDAVGERMRARLDQVGLTPAVGGRSGAIRSVLGHRRAKT